MKRLRICTAATAFLASACTYIDAAQDGQGLRVDTDHGLVVGEMSDGVRTFKGIPYAAPPVGELRWRPPVEPASWEGTRDATQFGPGCLVFDQTKLDRARFESGLGWDIIHDVPARPETQEDCLYLNIWAPVQADGAAVMVWLNPLGSSSNPLINGTSFARDGVVFVNFDYRQLTLGNFAHPALTAEAGPSQALGRFQTMDQMAALRWVKDNIDAFGGDPNNVTVFGVSAGGASTLQLLTIPDARGLFDKAIVQSGNGWWSPFDLQELEIVGVDMATSAGLPAADATAEQLRAISIEELPWFGAYSIDGRLQEEGATQAIAAGRVLDVPLMIGWTDFDGSSLRYDPQTVLDRTSPSVLATYDREGKSDEDLAYELYTDSHVGAPARWVAAQTEDGAPTYLYLFSYVYSGRRETLRGAEHGHDVIFVFDSWASAYPQLELPEEDRAATRMVHSCWVSFAETGQPQCEGAPKWPRYERAEDRIMELGLEPRVLTSYRHEQLDAQEAAMWSDVIADTRESVNELVRRLR